ncbi:predicted protein [Botrytis cinerea T4]|uniref:Uncharacterized protein n=1 Tax=Botryotinia fuckeliana (strain T4) TaxID=999810 RepID=G2XWV8_BOTF4|nr:predicted protein [Botrytis cinerea T4]
MDALISLSDLLKSRAGTSIEIFNFVFKFEAGALAPLTTSILITLTLELETTLAPPLAPPSSPTVPQIISGSTWGRRPRSLVQCTSLWNPLESTTSPVTTGEPEEPETYLNIPNTTFSRRTRSGAGTIAADRGK